MFFNRWFFELKMLINKEERERFNEFYKEQERIKLRHIFADLGKYEHPETGEECFLLKEEE